MKKTTESFNLFCRETFRGTHRNSPFVQVCDLLENNNLNIPGFALKSLPEGTVLTMAAGGIGTKTIPIVASGKFETAASDVLAMTAMNITRHGGIPLVFISNFDVKTLGECDSDLYKKCQAAVLGLKSLANKHEYVLIGASVEELGLCVGPNSKNTRLAFNWSGTMLGAYHPEKMIHGNTLAPGQFVVALRDNFRTADFANMRRALHLGHGLNWAHKAAALDDIIAVTAPSVQYDRFLNCAHGWLSKNGLSSLEPLIPVHLILPLSAGSLVRELGDKILAPRGLSADLWGLFAPSDIMRKCAKWLEYSDEECYAMWSGGQGALVVIDQEYVQDFIDLAGNFAVEAKVAGHISSARDYRVAIKSQFSGKNIYF